MTKFENIEVQEAEEIFDEELQELFGDRYQDKTVKKEEFEQALDDSSGKPNGTWRRVEAACGMIAGVGLLFYMIMTGKIDTAYGVLFTAGVSAACGYRMN